MAAVKKNITITTELEQYVLDSNLKLSSFVQDRLKERIIAEGKADTYLKNHKKN
jgi:hypothetical protein